MKVGLFKDAAPAGGGRLMKRVVVTGLGIVSPIGNNAAEVTQSLKEGKSGIEFVPAVSRPRLPQPGRRHAQAQCRGAGRPPPHALHGQRCGLRLPRHEGSDRRRRPRRGRDLQRAHRSCCGLGRPDDRRHRAGGPHRQGKGPQARRPVPGAARHVEHRLGQSRDRLQDQGPELFDQLGLLDLGALHRQRRRDHPARQGRPHVRGRRRGARLDAVGPVRRDGRDVVQVQRHAAARRAAPTTRTATAS